MPTEETPLEAAVNKALDAIEVVGGAVIEDLEDKSGVWTLVDRAVELARQEGIAEGLRQATEGGGREYRIEARYTTFQVPADEHDAEANARGLHAMYGGMLSSRLVGPWEPAEQPEPEEAGGEPRN